MTKTKITLFSLIAATSVTTLISLILGYNLVWNYEKAYHEASNATVSITDSDWYYPTQAHTYDPSYEGYKLQNTETERAYWIQFASQGKFTRIFISLKIYATNMDLIAEVESIEKYGYGPGSITLPYQTNVLVNKAIEEKSTLVIPTITPYK